MKGRAEVFRLRAQIDQTFKRIERRDASDFELRSDFAKFLCILLSGFIERSVQELAMECCRHMSSGPALNFALAQLDGRGANPTSERILQMVGSFDPSWGENLRSFLTQERKAALDSVVGLRNSIAHGGSATTSYARVCEYRDRIADVIDHLCNVFDPAAPVAS